MVRRVPVGRLFIAGYFAGAVYYLDVFADEIRSYSVLN